MAQGNVTIDHEAIRRWAEERDGHPSRVRRKSTNLGGRPGGILRIDFGEPEASLETISWEEFFDAFEGNGLAFLYQEKTEDGRTSRFFKFVDRDGVRDQIENEGGPQGDPSGGEDKDKDEEDIEEDDLIPLIDEEDEEDDEEEEEEGAAEG